MTSGRFGLALVLLGLLANNYAYLHDIVARDAPCIWMGPKSGALAAAGAALALIGAWLLLRRNRTPTRT